MLVILFFLIAIPGRAFAEHTDWFPQRARDYFAPAYPAATVDKLLESYLLKNPKPGFWKAGPPTPAKPFPQSEKEKRLNEWVKAFDALLREKFPDELASIPTPRVQSYPHYIPNAQVTGEAVCYQLPVRLRLREGPSREAARTTLIGGTGLAGWGMPEGGCVDEWVSMEELPDFFSLLEASSGCRLKLVRDATGKPEEIVFEKGCKVGNGISRETTHSSAITLFRERPTILVTTPLLGLPEAQVVATLAHELGHYYMAHNAIEKSKIPYLFRYADRVPFTIPRPLEGKDAKDFDLDRLIHLQNVESYRQRENYQRSDDPFSESVADVQQALGKVNDARISRYDSEGRADEFAVLLQTAAGLAADSSREGLRSLAKDAYPAKVMEKAIADRSTYVPYGHFMAAHPSIPHRLYSLTRHLDGLEVPKPARKFPMEMLPPGQWEKLSISVPESP